ncbi:uncharacterized protein LOC108144510 [Drosophila elegans]|uniref:uncharacterized protein LOC108144510 n=1 Tax=Drosophila elegans TaxID=30023 RepID=UPI0007E77DE5|nr:uncharacterized protein LOC108144510 [Drosophila elegans]
MLYIASDRTTNMKSIIRIGGLCLVVFVLSNLDVLRAQYTPSSSSPSTSSQGNPKQVYVSNLTYTVSRKIRVGSTTVSSTRSRSSRTNSNRKLNAKRSQAKRSQRANRKSDNRKSNARRVRG